MMRSPSSLFPHLVRLIQWRDHVCTVPRDPLQGGAGGRGGGALFRPPGTLGWAVGRQCRVAVAAVRAGARTGGSLGHHCAVERKNSVTTRFIARRRPALRLCTARMAFWFSSMGLRPEGSSSQDVATTEINCIGSCGHSEEKETTCFTR